MKPYKIIALNVLEKETQIAYFRNDGLVLSGKIEHGEDVLKGFETVPEQYQLRKRDVVEYLAKYGIRLSELDAIASTGNLSTGFFAHACWISEEMALEAKYGKHSGDFCNLGIRIAYNLANGSGRAAALTAKTDFEHGDEIAVLGKLTYEKLCGENSFFIEEQKEKIC